MNIFLCSRFILHIISTKSPSSLNSKILYFSISAFRYSPVTSKIAVSLPSEASIIRVVNNYSRDTVGDATDSPFFKYFHWLLLFAHVFSLILMSHYYLINFTAYNTFFYIWSWGCWDQQVPQLVFLPFILLPIA